MADPAPYVQLAVGPQRQLGLRVLQVAPHIAPAVRRGCHSPQRAVPPNLYGQGAVVAFQSIMEAAVKVRPRAAAARGCKP